jgi:ABC-type multidrug transport system fused ATPase/permease subunit
MLKNRIKAYSIIFFLLFIYSCGSSSFYQRQYLSGRYSDKISKPEKASVNKTSEFHLQEYPLSADVNNDVFISEIYEDTIPKIVSDTTNKKAETNQDDITYFSPDTLNSIKKNEKVCDVADSKQQMIFNDKLKRAAFKIFLSWLIRILGFVGIFFYILFSGSFLFGTVASIIVFGIILLLILFASLLYNYYAFTILIDADKMRLKNPGIKNLGWLYFLLGLNIYFIFVAFYYLVWMLFYGAVVLFFALV